MSQTDTLARRLRQAVDHAGLTQAELSRISGIDKASISLYLGGKYQPKAEKLHLLAAALGVTPQWLSGVDASFAAEEDAVFSLPVTEQITREGGVPVFHYSTRTHTFSRTLLGDRSADDFFLLQVSGLAMYPRLLEGDLLLMERTRTLTPNCTGAVLWEDALLLRRAVAGEEGWELLPWNPEFPPRRISGSFPDSVTVLGRGVLLLREL